MGKIKKIETSLENPAKKKRYYATSLRRLLKRNHLRLLQNRIGQSNEGAGADEIEDLLVGAELARDPVTDLKGDERVESVEDGVLGGVELLARQHEHAGRLAEQGVDDDLVGLAEGGGALQGGAGRHGSAAVGAVGLLRGGAGHQGGELGIGRPEDVGVVGRQLQARHYLRLARGLGLARDGGRYQRQDLLLADRLATDLRKHLLLSLRVLGQVARVADGCQVESRGWLPLPPPELHERVQEAVGRGVRRRSVVADDAGHGTQGDEEVQRRRVGQRRVDVPATCHLGLDYRLPLVELHLLE